MEQNPYKTAKFKKLFEKWNKKLVKAGHNEIEDFSKSEPTLKSFHDKEMYKRRITQDEFDSTSKYYSNAVDLLNTYKFTSDFERKVWELHSNGMSVRKIAKQVKKGKTWVHVTIAKVRKWQMPK